MCWTLFTPQRYFNMRRAIVVLGRAEQKHVSGKALRRLQLYLIIQTWVKKGQLWKNSTLRQGPEHSDQDSNWMLTALVGFSWQPFQT